MERLDIGKEKQHTRRNHDAGEGDGVEEVYVERLSPSELVEFARYGEPMLISELASQGLAERLLAVDGRQNSMLHMFAANGYIECIQKYLEHCPLEKRDEMLNHQNSEGNTALHWACVAGQLAAAQLLVAAGAKVAIENKAERTPICEAHKHRRSTLLEYFEEAFGRKESTDPEAGSEAESKVEQ